MRAYQAFLKIRENEKNSGGILEDFGSSMLNILKLPNQIKIPSIISNAFEKTHHKPGATN